MYERLIRDLKRTLFKVIGRTRLTRKELKRVIMDVQVNMNNRPITYVEDELGPCTLSPNSILNVKDQYLLQDDDNAQQQRHLVGTKTRKLSSCDT